MEQWDDRQLISAERRVPLAWAILFDRHHASVLAYLRRRCDSESARDVTAEVFAAAYLARARYDPTISGVRSWLLGIAAHKAADAERKRRREDAARVRLGFVPTAADGAFAEAEGLIAAEQLVQDLPRAQRHAVFERVVRDRTYEDIARDEACRPATIRGRVMLGLTRLRATYPSPELAAAGSRIGQDTGPDGPS